MVVENRIQRDTMPGIIPLQWLDTRYTRNIKGRPYGDSVSEGFEW